MMAEYRTLVAQRQDLEREVRASWGSSTMTLQRSRELARQLLKVRDRIDALEQTKSVGQLLKTRRSK